MKVNILHVSDTHLGKTQYGSSIRESDFSRSFDTVIDIAINENVDAVIHTGDLFDSRTPNTSVVSDAFDSIKRLQSKNISFLGIVGNHERKWKNQWIDILEKLDNVQRLGRDPFILKDTVSVYGFDSIRNSEWESMDFNVSNDNNDTINCVCMHELFEELVPPSKSDRSLEEVIERLNIDPDFMPLGDYHAAVDEEVNGVPAFYSGATERTSATQRDPTIRLIRIEDGEVNKYSWRKIKGVRENVPRPFYPINIDLQEESKRKQIRRRIEENIPENKIDKSVVVANLEGSSESSIKSKDVYNIMDSMGVLVKYVSDKRRPETLEFDSDSATDPTSINIDEMINNEIEQDVSRNLKVIDKNIVRDFSINKSNIRELIDDRFDITEGDKNED